MPDPPEALGPPQPCDCPECSSGDFDPQQLVDDLLAAAVDLVESEDPLDAEIVGATFLSMGAFAEEEFEQALVVGFIPQFEARGTTEALAMLLAIGSVAEGVVCDQVSAAAERMIAAGVARPGWAAELGEPVTTGDCWLLRDPADSGALLVGVFHRAGRSHALMMSVDNRDCGAADDIYVLDADQLPEALEMVVTGLGGMGGLGVTKESLDPVELRWRVENAMDARAVHDGEDDPGMFIDELDDDDEDGEDGPGYGALAVLVSTRMRALPVPRKPKARHGAATGKHPGLTSLQLLTRLAEDAGGGRGRGGQSLPSGRAGRGRLPARRKASAGPAPVYQLKVGLRGAKPPIWRRLEVPADCSLAALHEMIQIAFGWDDGHLHVFETPYGEFGRPDSELGHRAEDQVTLEQVAPAAGSKIRYTYDFGDDWEHDIQVEKVLDRRAGVVYPRCTGGRRAAPPDDCGGVWGYANLVEVLGDPADPEHADMVEWLGLDDASDFDPAAFDAGAVTEALSELA